MSAEYCCCCCGWRRWCWWWWCWWCRPSSFTEIFRLSSTWYDRIFSACIYSLGLSWHLVPVISWQTVSGRFYQCTWSAAVSPRYHLCMHLDYKPHTFIFHTHVCLLSSFSLSLSTIYLLFIFIVAKIALIISPFLM